ncbi:MAG: hypothetical protein FGM39_04090 [Phycisphaerales bacterium]|nr:hypothetical protein [Phycisphaerales bacterium]
MVARIRALKAEADRLAEQRQSAGRDEAIEMRRRIEQIAAELAAMPESEWTAWIMPYPSELGRAPGNANVPRGANSYIGEAVRRAESRLLLPGYSSVDFSVSNTLSEVVVRGERWMVALAAVALNEEITHVWNRVLVMEAERTALEFQERENKASESRAGLVRLDWPGGTLGEFVKAVQVAVPRQPVNVVLHERDGATGSVSSVHIGPISVRDVTPTALFRSLVYLAPQGNELLVQVTGDETPDAPGSGPGAREAGRAAGAPIITIWSRPTAGSPGAPSPAARPAVEIIDLSAYLFQDGTGLQAAPAKERLDRLMDAIGAALDLSGQLGVEARDFRIHEPTGLLMVKGDDAQRMLVRDVVERIIHREGPDPGGGKP